MEKPKVLNYSSEINATPRELFERGKKLEVAGDKRSAADLYMEAGYTHLAIQIYENEGDVQKAYEAAKQANDNFTLDRLAVTYDITSHEFSDFPPAQGRGFDEVMRIALKSRFQEGATAEKMGFIGFKDKIVADVGTRDGRFIPLFQELGAKEIFGIDPDGEALAKAVATGLLDERHALQYMLQDLPKEIRETFEIATVFNFNMPISEQADFFIELHESLPENGQAVLTIAEDEVFQNAIKFIEPYFAIKSQKLWNKSEDYPHKNLVILTKK